MLISCEVENFRSIYEPVELQLTAVNYYKEAQHQLIADGLPGLSGLKFLRACAIYGPNASGKTALWRALLTMRNMVIHSGSYSVSALCPYTPFGLIADAKEQPTRFSVTFVGGKTGVRFEYRFAYTAHAVVSEELLAYPKGFKQVWFSRSGTGSDTVVKGSSSVKIPSAVKPLLNDNMLLLSLLCNYPKYESYEAVWPVYEWFNDELNLVSRAPNALNDFPYSGDIVAGDQGSSFMREFIQDMMRRADVGITCAEVETRSMPSEMVEYLEKMDFPQEMVAADLKAVVFRHEAARGAMRLDFGDESDGTKQLFGMSGHIAEALEKGSTLFVDEVDASLHPVLVTEIVRTFLDPGSNSKGAQLIFTAHNPCLLESGLLRRDQVWFTEKDESGATELYPLSDYSPRKGETVLAGYLTGRYSAIPVVPACFGRCHEPERG